MKYTIVQRGDEFSRVVAVNLMERLNKLNYIQDDEEPTIIFTIGGDGTMLKAVHRYLPRISQVVFIGIHTGKLGFYTDYIHDELDLLEKGLIQREFTDLTFPLLKAEVCNGSGCQVHYALNEITLINPYHTQHLEVLINDEYFESFQGTGLCVSTPSGSSAYNKSLGGALLHPNVLAFQLTEIGSINNNVYRTIGSPMILPKEHIVTLKSTDFNEVTLTIDHMHQDLSGFDSIKCSLSDQVVTLRQFKANDFWNRIRKSFL
jgi:NAD+ kinase